MTDADKHKSIAALTLASQTCTAALSALASCDADVSVQPDPSVVCNDLDGLLALIYNLTTKLSLALKPSSPSYSASIPVLHALATHTSALAHCTSLLRQSLHGATLLKHVRSRVKELIEALRALIQTFLNHAARGPQMAGSGASGEEYLVRTGMLHDLITNARGPCGIPKNNQAAVYQSWKSDRESLEDNLQEIACMIKDAEAEDDQGNELDDDWDELGLGRSAKMDKVELARAKNVHQILRLTTLLHKRIFLDFLASPTSAPPSAFDTLLIQSKLLLTTSDDLVAALNAPQDPGHVREEIVVLAEIATSLQPHLAVFLPAADELDADTVAPTKETKKKTDQKWFGTCIDQIARLCTSLSESLSETESPT